LEEVTDKNLRLFVEG